jgi:predicted NAD/FAD-binding protein
MTKSLRIAVVGTGIAGNVAAHHLHRAGHDLTVFEAYDRIGGHTHTHRIALDGERHHIDTGFIVFNERTYPNFVALLDELGVASQPSSMSLSIRDAARDLEYNGSSLNGVFAQRRNLLRPRFVGMLSDILRFHRAAPALLADDGDETTLGAYLSTQRFGPRFVDDYLLPMGAAIWSTDPARMLEFPARFFVRFLHNHGMLTVDERPVWRVVTGGSRRYVDRLVAPWRDRIRLASPVELVRRLPDGVQLQVRGHPAEHFDHVFLACHADQALRMLADPSRDEREVLGALPYQHNEALLHTDVSLLPRRRRAWAAWNVHRLGDTPAGVSLTYNMNILQGLRSRHVFCVTLNAGQHVDPARVLRRLHYEHPLFTPASVAAQQRHHEISGVRRTHYCGAYWRYGFHEDGVVSAQQAIARFEASHPAEASGAQRAVSRVA